MKRTLTITLAFLPALVGTIAQPLSSMIPADAYLVIQVNPKAMLDKSGQQVFVRSPGFLQAMEDIANGIAEKSGMPLSDIFLSPAQSGVDLRQAFYIYVDAHLKPCFLFQLSDSALFGRWWQQRLSDSTYIAGNIDRSSATDPVSVYWNDRAGLLYFRDALPGLGMMTGDGEREDSLPDIFLMPIEPSLASDARYMADSRQSDIHCWINYGKFYQLQHAMVSSLGNRLNVPPAGGYTDTADAEAGTHAPYEEYDMEETPEPTYEQGFAEGYDVGFEDAIALYRLDTMRAFLDAQVTDTDTVEWNSLEEAGEIEPARMEDIIRLDENFADAENNTPAPPAKNLFEEASLEHLFDQVFNPRAFMSRMEMLNSQLRISMMVNFNDGQIDAQVKTYHNPLYYKMFELITHNRPNPKMWKYLPADRLIALGSVSYHTGNLYQQYKDYLIPMLDSSGIITDLMEAYSILLDEEAIFDMIEGDMVFAVTGINEYRTTTFEYENQGEEIIKKEVEITRSFPEILLMLTFREDANWKKLMRLLEKRKMLTRQGGVYTFSMPGYPVEIYLTFHDDLMLVTNNSELVHRQLQSGYQGNRRLKGALRKQFQRSNQSAFLDISHLLNGLGNLNLPGFTGNLQNIQRREFHSLSLWTEKRIHDSIVTRAELKVGASGVPALQTILRILDEEWGEKENKM